MCRFFNSKCSNLRVYAEYCTNNPTAIETLNVCAKNPNYQSFEDVINMIFKVFLIG